MGGFNVYGVGLDLLSLSGLMNPSLGSLFWSPYGEGAGVILRLKGLKEN